MTTAMPAPQALPPAAAPGSDAPEAHAGPEAQDLARIILVALAAAAVWFRLWEPFSRVSVIGLTGTLLGGWPIYREALRDIRERRMTMELSMTIALLAALAIGQFFTTLVITLFVLVAEVLEGLTVARGRRAISDLLDFLPRVASVRRSGEVCDVPLADVRANDVVLVKPGGRIPVDGTVLSGHSFVDQASVTGESLPVEKMRGAAVLASTINQSGALEIRAERLGRDTSFGKIVEAVERAERSRAPVQKLADRLAGYLVYFAIGAAVLTFLVTRDARSTISVVIVAGACGIAAGTPLAIVGAIGRAAHEGVIVKGGLYLEALATADTVVLDKTGTLTLGTPVVRAAFGVPPITAESVLAAAAMAERRSEHPLAKAILAHAATLGLPTLEPAEFTYEPGLGVIAKFDGQEILAGNLALLRTRGIRLDGLAGFPEDSTPRVYVARRGRLLGGIDVADPLRPEAIAAVASLKAMGMHTVLLTGDQRAVAADVASRLGVDEFGAEMLPEHKLNRIRELTCQGRRVVMVGDGVNDAPALVEATVGVAMGSGTDVARESADVVLLGNEVARLVETLRIARRARRIIMQNFAGTLAVDAVGMALAAVGLLSPLLAAFIHVASELTFILNSARLLPSRFTATLEGHG